MINEQIETYLKTLSLHRINEIYLDEAKKAAQAKLSYQDYLHRLLENQVFSKIDRSINRKMQIAAFPQIKTIEEFDFSFQPNLNEKLIRELASNLSFISEAKNVILLGAPGVGKTHIAIALGIKAVQARKRVLFFSAQKLNDMLAASDIANTFNKTLDYLARIDLLIIDELGYLALSKHTAKLFFQLINAKYEKSSIILTSNKPFELWGEIFQDDVVASAILDRLVHHCFPFFIDGKSFRLNNFNNF
jgi:DNA replication protein DnaC